MTIAKACLRLICLAVLSDVSHAFDGQESERPNIILMMADDHGWGDTGYRGHKFIRTPNLDQMAREGLQFERWYAAAPVCSPTRGSCLTGRHPFRYGIYSANVGRLKPEEICLAELLQDHGYATGHFGKWHLGTLTTRIKDANRGGPGSERVFSPPWQNGFQVCFSTESKVPTFNPMKNPASVSREARTRIPVGDFYGTRYWTGVNQFVSFDELTGDDSELITDRAIEFVKTSVAADQRFFAVIWFHAPHTPVVADAEHRNLYPDHPHGEYGQHYHGCITAMDEQIGRLRGVLQNLDVSQNTMLWYASDNGPESTARTGAGSAGILRGRKRSLFEGGVRVPATLVWPEKITSHRNVEMPCVSSDYFPTIVDVLGAELPDRPYDGVSLLPVIEGTSTERHQPIGFQHKNQIALVSGNDKLYSADKGKSWQLYDLEADPSETTDLAATKPRVLERLVSQTEAWLKSCRRSDQGDDY
jgi:arylsulfatase A-like enzyme